MLNSKDADETARWAVSSGFTLFAKPIIVACGSEELRSKFLKESKLHSVFSRSVRGICQKKIQRRQRMS